jgi:hypothetical protein
MPEAGLPATRRQIPIRIEALRRTGVLSIIGLPELIGLAGAALLAILVVFAYLYFYLPAGIRLTNAQLEKRRLEGEKQKSGVAYDEGRTTKDRVNSISNSLETFESNYLPSEESGRMSLYTTLNKLMKSNGVRNTAGPSYSPLDPVGTKRGAEPTVTAEKQSNAKWQSIYPGVTVSVTVEGPYQNIRHFVRDIELSRQFLIINAVELERVTQSGTAQDQPAIPPPLTGKPGSAKPPAGGLVSLRIDLATYFQRPETASATP